MTTAEPSGRPERAGGRDQDRTRPYAIGEGVLGGLLLALLGLALWYLAPVAPPTAAERWLVATVSVTISGVITGAWRPRRAPSSPSTPASGTASAPTSGSASASASPSASASASASASVSEGESGCGAADG